MIIHSIVNGKHKHVRKTLEAKRSAKLLQKKAHLLFPTDKLPNFISLAGSANVADTALQIGFSHGKKTKGIGALDNVKETLKLIPQAAFDALIDHLKKFNPSKAWDEIIYVLNDINEGNPSPTDINANDWQSISQAIAPKVEGLIKNLQDLEAFSSEIPVVQLLSDLYEDKESQKDSNGNEIGIIGKMKGMTDSSGAALSDALQNDMATLREPQLNDELKLFWSAFSANDKRYPDGTDIDQLEGFKNRRYRIICALPGGVVLEHMKGTISNMADMLITSVDLDSTLQRKVINVINRFIAQDFQCNNCTEDTHALAYVIQAVGHNDAKYDDADKITDSNDMFVVGRECIGSLITDADHFAGFEGEQSGDVVFSSKQAMDAVSQALEAFYVAYNNVKNAIMADEKRGDKDAPKAVGCIVDNGDTLEIRYCGRPMIPKMKDGKPEQAVDSSDYHPVSFIIPKGGSSKSFLRMAKKMTNALSAQFPETFRYTETLDDFNELIVANIRLYGNSTEGINTEDENVKKELAKFAGFSQEAKEKVLGIMHEALDITEFRASYDRGDDITSAYIILSDINDTITRKNMDTGFVIDFSTQDKKSNEVKMVVATPSGESRAVWEKAIVPCHTKCKAEDENGKVVEYEADYDLHVAWYGGNRKGTQSEVVSAKGSTVLRCMMAGNVTDKDDGENELPTDLKSMVLQKRNELNASLERTEYVIDVTDKESILSALNSIKSALSIWIDFINDAIKVCYENLSGLAEYLKISSKGEMRRFVRFTEFDKTMHAPSPNDQIKDYAAGQDKSPFQRFSTPKGKTNYSPSTATSLYYDQISSIIGKDGMKELLNGKSSNAAFAEFIKSNGLRTPGAARDKLRNLSQKFNTLPAADQDVVASLVSQAYPAIAESRTPLLHIDRNYN